MLAEMIPVEYKKLHGVKEKIQGNNSGEKH